jgi:hypothetical protein
VSVPSKIRNIQLVQIQPEERLATTSELNLASCLVTGCGEAKGMGYWAATQVKGLSHEIFIVPEADVVHVTEGSILIADSLIGTWRGDESLAGSETVARYQMDIMGTREGQGVLLSGVCPIKPINGKIVQMTLWESDQFIVPEKRSNACGGKGMVQRSYLLVLWVQVPPLQFSVWQCSYIQQPLGVTLRLKAWK